MYTNHLFYTALLCVTIYQRLAYGDTSIQKQVNPCSLDLWKYYDNTTKQCRCGSNLTETVKCDERNENVYVRTSYCMTYI